MTPPTSTRYAPTVLLGDCTTVLSAYVCPPLEEAVTTIRFARQHCFQSILTLCLFSDVLTLVKTGTAYKLLHINTQLVFQEGSHGPSHAFSATCHRQAKAFPILAPSLKKKKKVCAPMSHICLSRAV